MPGKSEDKPAQKPDNSKTPETTCPEVPSPPNFLGNRRKSNELQWSRIHH